MCRGPGAADLPIYFEERAMKEAVLETIQELIQEDVGRRGLRTDPEENLISASAGDFEAACRHVAATPNPRLLLVTGFFIPQAQPPAAETDGPLGAVFLARALAPLGVFVGIAALTAGLEVAGLQPSVLELPSPTLQGEPPRDFWGQYLDTVNVTHVIALERVGPSHTTESIASQPGADQESIDTFAREVPAEHRDRCHTMRGRDITAHTSPAHLLFEEARRRRLPTIGIGDGGNEIGMGKIAWKIIRRNIPNGGLVACRVPTDHLIVCGISNWGAYGLAAGIRHLRGAKRDAALYDPDVERRVLAALVERGPLVDGVTGRPTVSVDGLEFDRYVEPLRRLAALGG
jgi:D-glutamate cyclase